MARLVVLKNGILHGKAAKIFTNHVTFAVFMLESSSVTCIHILYLFGTLLFYKTTLLVYESFYA
jgi:hypothetical protein